MVYLLATVTVVLAITLIPIGLFICIMFFAKDEIMQELVVVPIIFTFSYIAILSRLVYLALRMVK